MYNTYNRCAYCYLHGMKLSMFIVLTNRAALSITFVTYIFVLYSSVAFDKSKHIVIKIFFCITLVANVEFYKIYIRHLGYITQHAMCLCIIHATYM